MTGAQFNELVKDAARVQRLGGTRRSGGGESPHHWKVQASRLDDAWRIDVGGGMVNGRAAVIDTPSADGSRVRRSVFSRSEPAWLRVEPPGDGTKLGPWRAVALAQRPAFFRGTLAVGTQTARSLNAFSITTDDRDALELYRCTIAVRGVRPPPSEILLLLPPLLPLPGTLVGVLSDIAIRSYLASLGVLDLLSVQALLPPFVISAVPPVVQKNDGTEVFPLADLWLTRDRGAGFTHDQVYVQQRAFWSFAAWQIVQDGDLLSILPLLQAMSDVGNLTATAIFETLLNNAVVRWWTV